MDELIKIFTDYPANRTLFSFWDGLFNIFIPFLLTLAVIYIYSKTHKGLSYSASFLKTLIILSICTSILMMLIGSNIARAFSLVGALSIIRFRTAVKDPIDVGYIFIAIAIGMACGTGFYTIAVTLTLGLCLILLILDQMKFGTKKLDSLLLHASYKSPEQTDGFYSILQEFLVDIALVSTESKEDGSGVNKSFIAKPRKDFSEVKLLEKLKKDIDPNISLSLVYQTESTPL